MNNDLILPDPQPSRADAVKNRALLLETAQALFEEQGVDAVSMTAIADTAGVGKGTLYRHFKNKQELCNALLDEDMRSLQDRTLRRLGGGGDACEDLRWFLDQVIFGLLTKMRPGIDHNYNADVLYVMLDVRTIIYQRDQMGYSREIIIDGLNNTLDKLAA
jgi:AcrR family transcriptional regulator